MSLPMRPNSSLSEQVEHSINEVARLITENNLLNAGKIAQIMHQLQISAILKDRVMPFSLYSQLELSGTEMLILNAQSESNLKFLDISSNPDLILLNNEVPPSLLELHAMNNSVRELSIASSNIRVLNISNNINLRIAGDKLPTCLEKLICETAGPRSLDLRKLQLLKYIDIDNNSVTRFYENKLPENLTELHARGSGAQEFDFSLVQVKSGSVKVIDLRGHKCAVENLACKKIELLDCSGNSCQQLDLSQVTTIKRLDCSNNKNLEIVELPKKVDVADFTNCNAIEMDVERSKIKQLLCNQEPIKKQSSGIFKQEPAQNQIEAESIFEVMQ